MARGERRDSKKESFWRGSPAAGCRCGPGVGGTRSPSRRLVAPSARGAQLGEFGDCVRTGARNRRRGGRGGGGSRSCWQVSGACT